MTIVELVSDRPQANPTIVPNDQFFWIITVRSQSELTNVKLNFSLIQGAGKVLSGTVTSVFGGVTMLWDMYQVK